MVAGSCLWLSASVFWGAAVVASLPNGFEFRDSQGQNSTISSLVNQWNPDAVKFAYDNWQSRTLGFLFRLDQNGVLALIEYEFSENSNSKGLLALEEDGLRGSGLVSSLSHEEWQVLGIKACVAFTKYLNYVCEISAIPKECQHEFLQNGAITALGAKSLPAEWLKRASDAFIGRLDAKHFNNFPDNVYSALVESNRCGPLNASALNKLKVEHWLKMTPQCLASICDLAAVEIPLNVLAQLPGDIFSAYNGPLNIKTIKGLTPRQANKYASLMPEFELICKDLDLEYLSMTAIEAITPRCLYGYLKGCYKRPKRLGRHWVWLTVVFEGFTEEMMDVIGNIDAEDFKLIPRKVIERIFTSKVAVQSLLNEKQKLDKITLDLKLSPKHYKFLVDNFGPWTVILIKNAKTLPDDIFSLFEAEDYKKLSSDQHQRFGVSDGLLQSLMERPNFGQIVTNFSRSSKTHFCSTLESGRRYIEKLWLREFVTYKCIKAFPFEIGGALLRRAPELERGNQSWSLFVKKNPELWLSMPSVVMKDLLQMTSFCAAISTFIPDNFLVEQHYSVVKVIRGRCAPFFYRLVNAEIVEKLASDFFGYFTVEIFPSRLGLKGLTPEQIRHVSENLPPNTDLHLFRHISSEEILELDQERLNAITLRQVTEHKKGGKCTPSFMDFANSKSFGKVDIDSLADALNSKVSLSKPTDKSNNRIQSGPIQSTGSRDETLPLPVQQQRQSTFEPLEIFNAEEPGKLRSLILRDKFPLAAPALNLEYSSSSGFDLEECRNVLLSQSSTFANPRMLLIVPNTRNLSGLDRVLVTQLLLKIGLEFSEPAGEFSKHRKFSRKLEHRDSLLIGLLVGKALQLDISPPFEFEEAFWALLIELSDFAITEYCKKNYQESLVSSPLIPLDSSILTWFRKVFKWFVKGLKLTIHTEWLVHVKNPSILAQTFKRK